jgi:hypothetical protein
MGSTHAGEDLERLDAAYLAFAAEMGTRILGWAQAERLETSLRMHVAFEPEWWHLEPIVGWEVYPIFHYQPDRLWEVESISQCLREHWDAGIFRHDVDVQDRFRAQASGKDNVSAATFEQFRESMFRELLRPLIEVMHGSIADADKECTFTPEHVLAAYHRYRAVWTSERVRWTATVPLVNFESNLTGEAAFGTHLRLAPFTSREKEQQTSPRMLYVSGHSHRRMQA